MDNKLYYKLICIDEQHASLACQVLTTPDPRSGQHAIIAEQQLNNAETNKLKAKRLGRAVVVSINKDGLEQKEISEINYMLSSVRVRAMAYDEELSQYDMDEVDKV